MLNRNAKGRPAGGSSTPTPRRHVAHYLRLLSFALALSGLGLTARAQSAPPPPAEFAPGEVIVKLASSDDLAAVAAQYKLSPVPLAQFGKRPIYRLRVLDGASPAERADELQRDAQLRVVFAEPNYLVRPPEGGGVMWAGGDQVGGDGGAADYAGQWAALKIRLPAAHAVTRGANVRIAVLDTGVDAAHPALAGHLLPGRDFVDMDDDPTEVGELGKGSFGHGTHIAGLLALVAPEAKIIPLRVLDPDGVSNIWVLAEALEYAVNPDGDAFTNDGAQVINISISTPRPTNLLLTTLRKITYERHDENGSELHTVEYNNIVVAAAGNSGTETPEYPAAESFHAMLAVAASDESDRLSSFSTRGPWVGLLAPGERVLSTVPGGGYATWSGTSMAAPLVAGAAALMRSALPAGSNAQIISHLVSTGEEVPGPVARRLDAGAALTTGVKPYVPKPVIQFGAGPAFEPKYYGTELRKSLKLTVWRSGDDTVPVSVNYATSDRAGAAGCDVVSGHASALCDYESAGGTLDFAPGERFKDIIIPLTKEYLREGNETFQLTLSSPVGATLGEKNVATLVIIDNEFAPPAVEFRAARFTVSENITNYITTNGATTVSHSAVIHVRRTGDPWEPVSVELRTMDDPAAVPCDPAARDAAGNPYPQGRAYARCDYATTIETLHFAPGQTFKDVYIPVVNDSYDEPEETFEVGFFNPAGAAVAGTNPVTVTITDDDLPGAARSPLASNDFFVRQHYLDFLSREPERAGQEAWLRVLGECPRAGDAAACDRVAVSAAFFRSAEFHTKGLYVYRFYPLAYGRLPRYTEMAAAMREVTGATAEEVYQRKAAFAERFAASDEFRRVYGEMSNADLVAALMDRYRLAALSTASPASPDGEAAKAALTRADLVAALDSGAMTRAAVLRAIADSDEVGAAEYNRAFVAMQYFGYLRRDPEPTGFNAWLDYLNANPTDFRTMVNGFVNSAEYRLRVGGL